VLVTIREAECIGCIKCIKVCPVDAIVGTQNQMHTVIADECIGCELCVPACPVDCIDLIENRQPSKNKELTLKRSRARKKRLGIVEEPMAKSAINQTLARIAVGLRKKR
jgi:electron transport complex protein RnfB